MTLTSVLASLGTAVGIAMALAPIPTMRTIADTKALGEFSVFPYIVTFCQCLLWMTYAGVTPGKGALLPVNIFICVVECAYCVIFLKYSSTTNRPDLIKTISLPLSVTVVGILLSFLTSSPSKFVGFFAVLSNIIMYAAPLAVVKTVIETKSVKYMPFLLSFVGTIASVIWSCWAVSANDSFVLVPNVLGIFLGLIQLAVYAKFRNADANSTEDAIRRYYTSTTAGAEPDEAQLSTVDSSLMKQ